MERQEQRFSVLTISRVWLIGVVCIPRPARERELKRFFDRAMRKEHGGKAGESAGRRRRKLQSPHPRSLSALASPTVPSVPSSLGSPHWDVTVRRSLTPLHSFLSHTQNHAAPRSSVMSEPGDDEQQQQQQALADEDQQQRDAEAAAEQQPEEEEVAAEEQAAVEEEEQQGEASIDEQQPVEQEGEPAEDEAAAAPDAEQADAAEEVQAPAEEEEVAADDAAAAAPEDHAEGQPSAERSQHDDAEAAAVDEQPEGAEGEEQPAEAELAAAQAASSEEAQPEQHEEDAQATTAGETGDAADDDHKQQETSDTNREEGTGGEEQQPEAEAAAEPEAEAEADAAQEPEPEPEVVQPPPDFSHLSGLELAKAQALHAHMQRMAALDRRMAEEDAYDVAMSAAIQEERIRFLEEADQQFDDDAELLGSVQPLPMDAAALNATRAEVEALRMQAADSVISVPPSLDELEDDAVVIDSIDIDEVRLEEQLVEAARVQRLKDDSAGFLARVEALKRRDIETKHRNDALHAALLEDVAKRKQLLGSSSTAWQEQQDKAFLKAQALLSAALETQKRLITNEYGTLEEVRPLNPDGRVRESPQAGAPRLLTLKIDCLRAIKNKLPGGFYVVLVTIYDRLGGHPLRWCTLGDSSGIAHSAMTPAPQRHGGKFYNLELQFNQESNLLALACPSLREGKPGNVVMFEVVSVRGGKHLTDRVLAWGAFPLMSADRALIHGRFKVPLFRGEINHALDKYSALSERLSTDIDYWLANLYFEATPIPVKASYEWSFKYGLPLRRQAAIMYKIDVAAIMGKGPAAKSGIGGFGKYSYGNSNTDGDKSDASGGSGGIGSGGPARISTPNLPSAGGTGSGGRGGSDTDLGPFGRHKGGAGGPQDLRGGGGVDEFILPSDLAAGEGNDLARKLASRERAKELRQYKHSITNPEADIPVSAAHEKLSFLWSELLGDLSLSRSQTLEFWSTLFLFVLAFWLRIYVHYFGQYLWLTSSWRNNYAVYEFTVTPTRCILRYQVEPLESVMTQAMVLVIGVVSNQLTLLGLILFSSLCFRAVGAYSDAFFRFLLVYAINVLFDPLFITLMDVFEQKWEDGDYFKIYHAYQSQYHGGAEGSIGYAGGFLTIVLAAILCAVSLVILFIYLTRLHMHGRMLDVYHRLHSDEGTFFVPNDLELSVRTLKYILAKSKKWTGFHGTRRKVLVRSTTHTHRRGTTSAREPAR